jgi:hypothetical protein
MKPALVTAPACPSTTPLSPEITPPALLVIEPPAASDTAAPLPPRIDPELTTLAAAPLAETPP